MCRFKSYIFNQGNIFGRKGVDSHAELVEIYCKKYYPQADANKVEDNSIKFEVLLDNQQLYVDTVPKSMKNKLSEGINRLRLHVKRHITPIIVEGLARRVITCDEIIAEKPRFGHHLLDKFLLEKESMKQVINQQEKRKKELQGKYNRLEALICKKVISGYDILTAHRLVEYLNARLKRIDEINIDELRRIEKIINYIETPISIHRELTIADYQGIDITTFEVVEA